MTNTIPSLAEVKVITFDFWQTLVLKVHPTYRKLQLELYQDMFETTAPFDEIYVLLRKADAACNKIMEDSGKDCGFEPRIRFLHEHLPENDKIKELTQDFLANLYRELEEIFATYPPVLFEEDILDTLAFFKKRNLRLGIISNTGSNGGDHLRRALVTHGIWNYIEPNLAIFSDEVKLSKPNKAIFQELLTRAQVQPDEYCHIGDNIKADYYGAVQAGCHAFHLSSDSPATSSITEIKTLCEYL